MSFIEELYYGKLDPQSRNSRPDRHVYDIVRSINEMENSITERLHGEDKRLFLDFVDAYDEYLGNAELDSFTCGFRLGAAFAYDTFVGPAGR